MDGTQIACPQCDSPLLQVDDWSRHSSSVWEIALRCPECGWAERSLFDRAACAWLEERLEAGVEQMLAALVELERESMEQWAVEFVAALDANAVRPHHFR